MNTWMLLLGDGARSEQFAKGFREGNLTRTPYHVLLLLAAAVLAITIVFYISERFRKTRRSGSVKCDRKLFRELCRIHRLDRCAIGQLQQMARRESLANSSEVFIRPDLFSKSEQATLKERLFGSHEHLMKCQH